MMTQADRLSQQLRNKIRHAHEPDNPSLINIWLDMQESHVMSRPTDQRWALCSDTIDVLLDTYADELNPPHWRSLCLDSLVRPLCTLQSMVQSQQQRHALQTIMQNITTISHYYAASCCHFSNQKKGDL